MNEFKSQEARSLPAEFLDRVGQPACGGGLGARKRAGLRLAYSSNCPRLPGF